MTLDRNGLADQAMKLHQAGNLSAAIALYEQALAGDPVPAPIVQYYAGMAYLSASKPRKAELLLAPAAAAMSRADVHFAHGNALALLKRHARAQKAFEAAARLDPSNASLWFNLGNAAEAAGDDDTAIRAFTTTLDNDPLLIRALPNLITVMARAGRFADMATLMRQMHRLAMWKASFYDVSLIGIPAAATAMERGDPVQAGLREMIVDKPADVELLCLLANFLFMRLELDEARALYIEAAKLSDQAGAKRAAGMLLAIRGDARGAKKYLKDTVEQDPTGEQLLKLANLYVQLSPKKPEAIAFFDILRDIYPSSELLFEAHSSWLSTVGDWRNLARILEVRIKTKPTANTLSDLAAAYINLKDEISAVKHLRRAVKMDRKHYSAWYNLSTVLTQMGKDVEAFEAGKKAFQLKPYKIPAVSSLSLIATKINQVAEAVRILKRGLKYNPTSPELLNLLGNNYLRRGDMKGALTYFAEARRHAANDGAQFAMQLMAVNYSTEVPPEIVAEMHFKWGDAYVGSVKNCNVPAPSQLKKRLKIGFMSGDYKGHSCSFFIGPLLANLDPERVEVFCYMTEEFSDETTLKFRRTTRHWREIAKLTDQQAIDLIRQDGIDILVELSGHTSGNRLGLMAAKPVPIQVSWLGYPNTTGLSTIDYRFTDALADPPGMTDKYFREKLYRLPNFLCYQPPEYTPLVAPLPAKLTGQLTFGCFNNSNKITDEVVAVWAKIMKRLPDSKMMLKTSNLADHHALSAFRRKFERNGIDPARIDCFQGFRNKSDHLMTYSDIDLALDPFPYNGTTTTFESLWMGVPMVTLEGSMHAGRVGHSIMTAVGLGEFVATSIKDYIDKAVSIASDLDALEAYRLSLRERLQNSPLMDGKGFAHSMEDAFFDMWQHAVSETKTRRKASA